MSTPQADPAIRERCESGQPLLEVRNLVKEIEGRRLLDRVSFSIDAGERLAVTGPSGAGKSLLLRCLNRLVEPTGGTITLCGIDITAIDPPALRRRVCLVSQRPVLFPGTVRENLEYPFSFAANRDLSKPDFEAIVEAVGLIPSLLEHGARTLSGGQQQRVAIARALAISPDVLLLDEPTSSLDPESEALVDATVMRLSKREGITIVLVTHDRSQAERIGDRIMRIEGGRVAGITRDAYG
jgi:putative ABC transport system ATP-binding protein